MIKLKEYSSIIKDIYLKFKNEYRLTLLDLQQYFEEVIKNLQKIIYIC